MKLSQRLTYANVIATLALFLAIGGGTVYAALELGKNDVKSKNIAKGAVKKSDLHKDSVTSPKVKDGTIQADDIAAGVISKLDADVTGSASAGPQAGLNTNAASPLPLSGTTSFTPNAGDVAAIAAEGQFTIATTNVAQACQPSVSVYVNGERTRVFVDPATNGNTTAPVTSLGRDADGPFGMINPGTTMNITAQLQGDADCTAGSQLDRLELRILQIR